MGPLQSFSARVAALVASIVLSAGILTLAVGFGYLVHDDYTQRSALPPEIRAELAAMDSRAILGTLSTEEALRYDEIGDDYYIDPPLVVIAASFAAPLFLMALAGAGAAALLAHRMAQPITVVARQARRIAAGDLAARASGLAPKSRVAEIAGLVEDFDILASKLQASEAALARDAAAIAHELATPLMVVRGTAQALIDGVYAPDQQTIERIIRQTDQMSRIVEDLRVLSLASAHRLILKREVVDLADLVREIEADFTPRITAAGMHFFVEACSAVAIADPARVRQALAVFVENGLRYAAEGKELHIRTSMAADSAAIIVMDRGPGPPEVAGGSIFDAFVRGDASRSRQSGGSGLGLAVAKAIAEAHGGRVGVDKREGGGSVFTLSLTAALVNGNDLESP